MILPKHKPEPGHSIALQLPRAHPRRWHLALARELSARGHRVGVVWRDAGAEPVAGMHLLGMLEKTLYSVSLADEARYDLPVTPHAFDAFPARERAELALDCCGLPLGDVADIPTLQPVFDGCLNEAGLIDALCDGYPPTIGWCRSADGALVTSGRAAISNPHILTHGMSETLSRLVSMAGRAVDDARATPPRIVSPRRMSRSGVWRLASRSAVIVGERILDRINRKITTNAQWNIALRPNLPGSGILETGRLCLDGFKWLPRDATRYFADPFPFEANGQRMLFCEEFPYATHKGIISVAPILDDGSCGPMRPVLECDCHLSYPAIFAHDGQIWMIPETTGARTLELYRADPFPHSWTLHAVLAEDIYLADATFFTHDGLCWISASTVEHGGSDRDALSLFYAEKLEGPSTPHPLNPVLVDVHGARPGGWLERCADGLRRPAQNCDGGYGRGITISRIDHLDRETYRETQLVRLLPPKEIGATGLHTVNRAAGIEVIDAIV